MLIGSTTRIIVAYSVAKIYVMSAPMICTRWTIHLDPLTPR